MWTDDNINTPTACEACIFTAEDTIHISCDGAVRGRSRLGASPQWTTFERRASAGRVRDESYFKPVFVFACHVVATVATCLLQLQVAQGSHACLCATVKCSNAHAQCREATLNKITINDRSLQGYTIHVQSCLTEPSAWWTAAAASMPRESFTHWPGANLRMLTWPVQPHSTEQATRTICRRTRSAT